MPDNFEYHFVTDWRFDAAIEEVYEILWDAPGFTRWWPAVYLDVREREPEDNQTGAASRFDFHTRGWLPYTLRWQCQVTETDAPHGFALEVWGDLGGRGVWRLTQREAQAHVQYDWRVSANKRLLRRTAWLLRPVFAANHRWAMRMGQQSLALELRRRRAATPEQRLAIPAPPRGVRWPGMRP